MKSPLAHLARVRGVCSAARVSCARAFPSSQRWTSRRMLVGISKLFEETSVATRWELGVRGASTERRAAAPAGVCCASAPPAAASGPPRRAAARRGPLRL